jgi:hypothetical protein
MGVVKNVYLAPFRGLFSKILFLSAQTRPHMTYKPRKGVSPSIDAR